MAVVGFKKANGPETLSSRRDRFRPDGVHRVSQNDRLRGANPGLRDVDGRLA